MEGILTIGDAERIHLCTALTAHCIARLWRLWPELRGELLIVDGLAVFFGETLMIVMFRASKIFAG